MQVISLTFADDAFRSSKWSSAGAITTTGDELTIPVSVTASRTSGINFATSTISAIDIRARKVSSNSTIVLTLYNSANAQLFNASIVLTNTYHTFNTFSGSLSVGTISKINLQSTNDASVIDFIAFEQNGGTNLDIGGMLLPITINKKTVEQEIPLATNIIQQIGIYSRSLEVFSPKQPLSVYTTLESLTISNTPILFNTFTQQATGYLTNVERNIQAGTVPVLYDLTVDLLKTDSAYP